METTITKKCIDDFVSRYSPDKVEQEKDLIIAESSLAQALEKYEKTMNHHHPSDHSSIRYLEVQQPFQEVLSPAEINAFLLHTMKQSEHRNYDDYTSYITTKLIHNSFITGKNGFVLNTEFTSPISRMGSFLAGTEERKLAVKLIGPQANFSFHKAMHIDAEFVGDASYQFAIGTTDSTYKARGELRKECFSSAYQCNILLEGNARSALGIYMCKSSMIIRGHAGDSLAHRAKDSSFEIYGDVGPECGFEAAGCTFIFHGKVDERSFHRSTDCIFKTDNQDTLDKLLRDVPKKKYSTSTGNKVIFIHPDGEEEIADGD